MAKIIIYPIHYAFTNAAKTRHCLLFINELNILFIYNKALIQHFRSTLKCYSEQRNFIFFGYKFDNLWNRLM